MSDIYGLSDPAYHGAVNGLATALDEGIDPGHSATDYRIASESATPAEAVRAMSRSEKNRFLAGRFASDIGTASPATAKMLADPQYAAFVKDDPRKAGLAERMMTKLMPDSFGRFVKPSTVNQAFSVGMTAGAYGLRESAPVVGATQQMINAREELKGIEANEKALAAGKSRQELFADEEDPTGEANYVAFMHSKDKRKQELKDRMTDLGNAIAWTNATRMLYPQSEDTEKFNQMGEQGASSRELLWFALTHPVMMTDVASRSGAQMLPFAFLGGGVGGLAARFAVGAGGASVKAATALGRGIAMGSTFQTSRALDLSGEVISHLSDAGVNALDGNAIADRFMNPEHDAEMDEVIGKARSRANAVGALDAISMRLAAANPVETTLSGAFKLASVIPGKAGEVTRGILPKPAQGASVGRTLLAEGVMQPMAQGALGAAGEALGQYITDGRITSKADVIAEAVGEFTTAPIEAMQASMSAVAEKRTQTERAEQTAAGILAVAKAVAEDPVAASSPEALKITLDAAQQLNKSASGNKKNSIVVSRQALKDAGLEDKLTLRSPTYAEQRNSEDGQIRFSWGAFATELLPLDPEGKVLSEIVSVEGNPSLKFAQIEEKAVAAHQLLLARAKKAQERREAREGFSQGRQEVSRALDEQMKNMSAMAPAEKTAVKALVLTFVESTARDLGVSPAEVWREVGTTFLGWEDLAVVDGRITPVPGYGINRRETVQALEAVVKASTPQERAAAQEAAAGSRDVKTLSEAETRIYDALKKLEALQLEAEEIAEYMKAEDARGFFARDAKGSSVVVRLKDARRATFLHELGHYFLESRIRIATRLARERNKAGNPEATEGELHLLQNADMILKGLGFNPELKNGESLGAAWLKLPENERAVYHERFAEGFEAYALLGHAPNAKVRRAMRQFEEFLKNSYAAFEIHSDLAMSPEVLEMYGNLFEASQAIRNREVEEALGYDVELIKALGIQVDEDELEAARFDVVMEAEASYLADSSDAARKLRRSLLAADSKVNEDAARRFAKIREEVEKAMEEDPVYGRLLKAVELLRAARSGTLGLSRNEMTEWEKLTPARRRALPKKTREAYLSEHRAELARRKERAKVAPPPLYSEEEQAVLEHDEWENLTKEERQKLPKEEKKRLRAEHQLRVRQRAETKALGRVRREEREYDALLADFREFRIPSWYLVRKMTGEGTSRHRIFSDTDIDFLVNLGVVSRQSAPELLTRKQDAKGKPLDPAALERRERYLREANGYMHDLATGLGYENFNALIHSLLDDYPSLQGQIDLQAQRKLQESDPSIATPDERFQMALEAVHGKARVRYNQLLLSYLLRQNREIARRITDMSVDRARQDVLKKNVSFLSQGEIRSAIMASRTAAAEFKSCAARGDIEGMIDAKAREIYLDAYATELKETRDRIAKATAAAKKYMTKAPARTPAEGRYREVIQRLLLLMSDNQVPSEDSKYGLTRREILAKRMGINIRNPDGTLISAWKELEKLLQEKTDDPDLLKALGTGTDIEMSPDLEAAIKADLIGSLRPDGTGSSFEATYFFDIQGRLQLFDLVDQLEKAMKRETQIEINGRKLDLAAVASRIEEKMNAWAESRGRKPKDERESEEVGLYSAVKQKLVRFGILHLRIPTMLAMFEGVRNGMLFEAVIRPMQECDSRHEQQKAKYTLKLAEILGSLYGKDFLANRELVAVKALDGARLSRAEVFALALNLGNAGNIERILMHPETISYEFKEKVENGQAEWNEQVLLNAVGEVLDRDQLGRVQAVLDVFHEVQKETDAVARRITGRPPVWVLDKPQKIMLKDGSVFDFKGGYYPIVYDPGKTSSREHTEIQGISDVSGNFYAASVFDGHLQQRAQTVTGDHAVSLTLRGIFEGLENQLYYNSWAEWCNSSRRLLRQIEPTVRRLYGAQYARAIREWLDSIATGGRKQGQPEDVIANFLRSGVSLAGIGFNLVSGIIQITGYTQSVAALGGKWAGIGLSDFLKNPKRLREEISAMSPMMAGRVQTQFRELQEIQARANGTNTKFMDKLMRTAYIPVVFFQSFVDFATWQGAYLKAMQEPHVTHDDAVAMADRLVLDTQGSGRLSELSGIERGGAMARLFTVFYTFFNTTLNLALFTGETEAGVKRATHLLMILALQPMLESLLRATVAKATGSGGDEDLDEWLKKTAIAGVKSIGSFNLGLLVGVRELSGLLDGYGYQGPSGLRKLQDLYRVKDALLAKEWGVKTITTVNSAIGSAFGLPMVPVNRAITGGAALYRGDTSNPLALVFGYKKPE